MKKFLFFTTFLIFIIVLFFLRIPGETHKMAVVEFNNFQIFANTAENLEKQSAGLSNLDYLPENQGLLFVYQSKDYRSFWMKDMKFPLDIIFIDQDTVVEIATLNIPKDSEIPRYESKNKANFVLEVNAGFTDRHQVKVGDRVKISLE